jgi:hypothetical protein
VAGEGRKLRQINQFGALAFGLPRTFFPSREFQLAIKFDF